jgi:nanoRNase/pAp phosphatase (c-di-AMP/oligoRNAs hydrolase)
MSKQQLDLLLGAVKGLLPGKVKGLLPGKVKGLLPGTATTILILPHNDPDPDAVASAVALRYLLAVRLQIEATIAYEGFIGRAENKALVNYLGQPLQSLTSMDLASTSLVAIVDTQPGAGNNTIPAGAQPVIVIDHHPWREATALAKFADVRTEVGATSTILTEYLQAAGLEPETQLATALFYGIKTDTMGLSRGVSPADAGAYFYLQPKIDADALVEIERAQVPLDYFQSFDTTLRAARLYDHVVISYIGPMTYPDLAAEMADVLLRIEGCEWVICLGVYQDELILAIRTRSRQGGAGRLAQALVKAQGTAGGHGVMAGGHIPLRGRDPKRVAYRINRAALQYLNISAETEKRLV